MDDREPNDRDGEMDPEDAARWRAARTLADLGELTAQWLEGKIASIPAVVPGCGPGEETAELIPVLAACNRAGYVTTVSRPGEEPVPSPTSWRFSVGRATVYRGYGQDKHATHSGPASPCVEALARPRRGSGRQRDCLFSEAVDQVFRPKASGSLKSERGWLQRTSLL